MTWRSFTLRAVLAVAILAVAMMAFPLETPQVEVWTPDNYPAGAAFEARADAIACTPTRWTWAVPAGCSAVNPSTTNRIQIRCSSGGPSFKVVAKAMGGGCAGASGSSWVVVATAQPVQWTLPVCDADGATPQAIITPPASGVYYRPGIQSTGRLNMLVVPGGMSIRTQAVCVERKGGQ